MAQIIRNKHASGKAEGQKHGYQSSKNTNNQPPENIQ
jgi:hypothetical protein